MELDTVLASRKIGNRHRRHTAFGAVHNDLYAVAGGFIYDGVILGRASGNL